MPTIFGGATEDFIRALEEELALRKTRQFVLLFSLGSQFDHLIVQQISALGAYCLVADPARVRTADVKKIKPSGIILSGGPANISDKRPPFDARIFDLGIPTLGVCLGFQPWADHVGCSVVAGEKREFGIHTFSRRGADPLFKGVPKKTPVLQSHGDSIRPNRAITILGSTENAPVAAARYKHLWGVQFHPEVSDTVHGAKIYDNFLKICGITARCAQLPYDFLDRVSRRITNEVREVAAVVYRISDKPPATIEWG